MASIGDPIGNLREEFMAHHHDLLHILYLYHAHSNHSSLQMVHMNLDPKIILYIMHPLSPSCMAVIRHFLSMVTIMEVVTFNTFKIHFILNIASLSVIHHPNLVLKGRETFFCLVLYLCISPSH